MKILILTGVPQSTGRQAVKAEAERRGHQVDFMEPRAVGLDEASLIELIEIARHYDVFHHATGLGEILLSQVHDKLRGTSTHSVNDRGVVTYDPRNKISQALAFSTHQVSVPKTCRSDRPNYDELASLVGIPFIAKDPHGTKGKSVWLIKSHDDLSVLGEGEHLYQEYIESDGDYRVHVVGLKTAFCAYRRMNPKGDFRSNIAQGGSVAPIDNFNELERVNALAVKAAQAMKLDYCGVDILRSKVDDRLYVLETNLDPGFSLVESVTGQSFAVPIVDYYEQLASLR